MPLPVGFLALCATVLLRLHFCRDVVSGPFFCMCPLGGEISAIKGLSMPSGRRLHSEHVNLSRCLCPHLFFFFWCLMFHTLLSIHLKSTFDILFGILSCFHWRDGQRMQSALLTQTGVLLYNLFCVFAVVHI